MIDDTTVMLAWLAFVCVLLVAYGYLTYREAGRIDEHDIDSGFEP